jgi:hypothetical protein
VADHGVTMNAAAFEPSVVIPPLERTHAAVVTPSRALHEPVFAALRAARVPIRHDGVAADPPPADGSLGTAWAETSRAA